MEGSTAEHVATPSAAAVSGELFVGWLSLQTGSAHAQCQWQQQWQEQRAIACRNTLMQRAAAASSGAQSMCSFDHLLLMITVSIQGLQGHVGGGGADRKGLLVACGVVMGQWVAVSLPLAAALGSCCCKGPTPQSRGNQRIASRVRSTGLGGESQLSAACTAD